MRKILLNLMMVAATLSVLAWCAIMIFGWIGWRTVSSDVAFFDPARALISCMLFVRVSYMTERNRVPWFSMLLVVLSLVAIIEIVTGQQILPQPPHDIRKP